MPLPPNTLAELRRNMARLGFVVSQIREIEEARQKRLEQEHETGHHAMVRRLARKGQPLVHQHGFTDSLETWYDLGYVEALKSHYRLILIDARGHGASDKPREPDAYAKCRRHNDCPG
jgi:pimeloyl-ACP methyl ester carboxylesterase